MTFQQMQLMQYMRPQPFKWLQRVPGCLVQQSWMRWDKDLSWNAADLWHVRHDQYMSPQSPMLTGLCMMHRWRCVSRGLPGQPHRASSSRTRAARMPRCPHRASRAGPPSMTPLATHAPPMASSRPHPPRYCSAKQAPALSTSIFTHHDWPCAGSLSHICLADGLHLQNSNLDTFPTATCRWWNKTGRLSRPQNRTFNHGTHSHMALLTPWRMCTQESRGAADMRPTDLRSLLTRRREGSSPQLSQ